MSYPYILKCSSSKDDVSFEDLESLLTQVIDDINLIYPDEVGQVTAELVDGASETIRAYFGEIQQNLSA
ncbi:hypothetical protein [Methanolobus sp. ZRKC5]|uniref:hypothetical protein n=1 Tax=unclassified Methanolobus TaxID=2629569 RepID=UPI00313ACDBC